MKTIMEHLFSRDSEKEILGAFPSLTKEDLITSEKFMLKMMEHGCSFV